MRSSPFGPCGGGSGTRSQIGAQVLVLLDRLEAGGVGVLQVLQDPHPAALVEARC